MILWLVFACVEAPPAPADPVPADPARPPNVLVLLTDDQGVDSVGVYAKHPSPPPTPHIDQLAAEGVRFENAWSYPVCSPSRAALLTGRLGRRTGVGTTFSYLDGKELRTTEILIPRMLEGAPDTWSSAAIGKWHLAAYDSTHSVNHPLELGFGQFVGSMNNLGDAVLEDGQDHGYHHWEQVVEGELVKNDVYATTFTVDEALAAMERLPEPWFVYVAFHAPHSPFDLPPDALTPTLDAEARSPKAERYPLVVEALDQEIGRLLDAMGDQRSDTLIVFASDNGTPEDATLPPWDGARAKNSPFEGGIRVPLIVSGPGVVQPGRTSQALVHLVDVFATVADVASVPLGPDGSGALAGVPIDGISLLPLLRDADAVGARDVLHTERFTPNGPGPYMVDWRMSRTERFKVIDVGGDVPLAVYALDAAPVEIGPPVVVESLDAANRDEVDALIDAHFEAFEALEAANNGARP